MKIHYVPLTSELWDSLTHVWVDSANGATWFIGVGYTDGPVDDQASLWTGAQLVNLSASQLMSVLGPQVQLSQTLFASAYEAEKTARRLANSYRSRSTGSWVEFYDWMATPVTAAQQHGSEVWTAADYAHRRAEIRTEWESLRNQPED